MTLRRLVLLRHGQTDFNATGRMQGHLESVLTDAGREQAARVAPVLAAMDPARLVSSDLQRAVESADAIAAATGLPVKVDPRLRETHLGEWQGLSVVEVEQGWPGALGLWRADPAWTPPGGESRIDVVRRAMPVVDELDAEFDGPPSATAVVVAHGGMIAGLVSGLLALPIVAWPAIGGIGNCRWAMLARRDDHPRWRLTGYNVGP
ncbi:MAG: histidine phosphatase family protein [Pseudonocardia sp.]